MSKDKLTVSGFIRAMQKQFQRRTDLPTDQALVVAINSLEAWETVFKEPVKFTEECAHEIVDTELEHWND